MLTLAESQVPPKATVTPILSWIWKIKQKACGLRQGQGEITHWLVSRAKQTQLGQNITNFINQNESRIMWKKPLNLETTSSTPIFSPS